MAERVGIDRSFLADVERGKRNISILNLEIIAKGLRVSLSQLLTRLSAMAMDGSRARISRTAQHQLAIWIKRLSICSGGMSGTAEMCSKECSDYYAYGICPFQLLHRLTNRNASPEQAPPADLARIRAAARARWAKWRRQG